MNTFTQKADADKPSLEAEGALAMYIAEHTSIQAIDHLTELCKNKFCVSKIHRTKCTAIIREVLAPHFRSTLKNTHANVRRV